MVGIMTMTIIIAHVMTMVMAGDMAVAPREIVVTVRLPSVARAKTRAASRGQLTAPTARRRTVVVRDSANNVAPR